jgi:hypothetical protein
MRIGDARGLSGLARKTIEFASDFAGVIRHLIRDISDSYRREPRYARAVSGISRDRRRRGERFD